MPLATMVQSDLDALESVVDKFGLPAVLDALGAICREKSEHLRASWQDTLAARVWDNAARVCETASTRDSVRATWSNRL